MNNNLPPVLKKPPVNWSEQIEKKHREIKKRENCNRTKWHDLVQRKDKEMLKEYAKQANSRIGSHAHNPYCFVAQQPQPEPKPLDDKELEIFLNAIDNGYNSSNNGI